MSTTNLSATAEFYLGVIREAGEMWIPPDKWKRASAYEDTGTPAIEHIGGAGAAASLRSLQKRGLIRLGVIYGVPYSASITEAGLVAYEKIADRRRKESA